MSQEPRDGNSLLSTGAVPKGVDKEEWEKIISDFPGLTERYRRAAEMLCSSWTKREEAIAQIEEDGTETKVGSQGQPVPSDASRKLRRAEEQIFAYLKELGGTPLSHQRFQEAAKKSKTKGRRFVR